MPVHLAGARSAGRSAGRPGSPWLARCGLDWLDLAAVDGLAGSIWLSWSFLGVLAARSGCPGRPWTSIWLRMGSVFIDFAAQGQYFVKVALGASIWWPCALQDALAASIWRSWGALGTLLGRSWVFLGRSRPLLEGSSRGENGGLSPQGDLGSIVTPQGSILGSPGIDFGASGHRFFFLREAIRRAIWR